MRHSGKSPSGNAKDGPTTSPCLITAWPLRERKRRNDLPPFLPLIFTPALSPAMTCHVGGKACYCIITVTLRKVLSCLCFPSY